MKKYLFISIIVLFSLISLQYVAAETITTSDPLVASVKELQTQVAKLKLEVAAYKKNGITPTEKAALVNRIFALKSSITTLQAKVIAYEKSPQFAQQGTILSQASLSITPPPTTIYRGEPYTLTWKASGIDTVGILLKPVTTSSSYLQAPSALANAVIPASQGSFVWTTTTSFANGEYQFVIYNAKGGMQYTSSSFRLAQKPAPTPQGALYSVSFLNPSGGASQFIETDSTYSIQWSTIGQGNPLIVNLLGYNGSRSELGEHANNPGNNVFSWQLPANLLAQKYKIELVDKITHNVVAGSVDWFTVVPPEARISSISPTSGPVGTTITITGSYFKPTRNYIALTGPSGGVISQYADSSDGRTLTFTVPTSYQISGAWRLYVDLSNTVTFTITNPQGFFVSSDNTSSFIPGRTYAFTWNGPTLNDVSVSLTKNGTAVTTVNAGTLQNSGRVSLSIPSNAFGQYQITAKTGNNTIDLISNTIDVRSSPSSSPTPSGSGSALRDGNSADNVAAVIEIIHRYFNALKSR